MKHAIAALIVLCAAAMAIGQTAAPAATAGDEQVRKATQEWLTAEAKVDVPTLQKLFHPDFVGMNMGGGVVTRNDIVPIEGSEARGGAFTDTTLAESSIKVSGETAVVLGSLRRGGDHPGTMRFTMFWKRSAAGQWQIVSAHLG